jgi:hypothetical protein
MTDPQTRSRPSAAHAGADVAALEALRRALGKSGSISDC